MPGKISLCSLSSTYIVLEDDGDATSIAVSDRYMFDEFQTDSESCLRRPDIETLYDVFVNIRDDEAEHVKTMVACQKPDAQKNLKSPNTPAKAGEKLDLSPVSNEEFQAAKQEEAELVGTQRSQPTKS